MAPTFTVWSWQQHMPAWAPLTNVSQREATDLVARSYRAAIAEQRYGAAFTVTPTGGKPPADPRTLGVPVVGDTLTVGTRDVTPGGAARTRYTTALYRAADLEPGDVIKHTSAWRLVTHVFTAYKRPTDADRGALGHEVADRVDREFLPGTDRRRVVVVTDTRPGLDAVIALDPLTLVGTQVPA